MRPLCDFSNTHGGVYVREKEEQAKRIAEQGVGRNYPIGIVAPFPMEIGVKQPESICVEFIKQNGDYSQKISMQAYLHQVTHMLTLNIARQHPLSAFKNLALPKVRYAI